MKNKRQLWDFPGGTMAKTPHLQCRGPGLDPGQRMRSHMPQLKMIPHAATKKLRPTTAKYINKYFLKGNHDMGIKQDDSYLYYM